MSTPQRSGLLGRGWEATQIKVFGRWVAKHLKSRGISFDNIQEEFEDGTKLVNLLEIIGKEDIGGKWHKTPKLRVQKIENCDLAIKYITGKGIKLVGISGGDIVDKNLKLTLGLTWSVINKFQIEDISVEEATARDALLIWCKKNTQGYADVNVTNFSSSWSSGLAFCALINKFRPQLLDYNALDRSNHTQNCEKAFEACKELGITVFLDPEDLVDVQPDEKSVVTQVAEFFHFFASDSKLSAMADKAKRAIAIQKQIDELKSAYIAEATQWQETMNNEEAQIMNDDYEKTVPGTTNKLSEVIKFGRDARPKIVELKAKAMKSWNAWCTKCKTNNRHPPVVPEGLEPETLSTKFTDLDAAQKKRREELAAKLAELRQAKVDAFDGKAKEIVDQAEGITKNVQELDGPTSEKIEKCTSLVGEADGIIANVPALQPQYDELVELKLNTRAKNTMYSLQSEAEQTKALAERTLERLKSDLINEQNKGKIDSYTEIAKPKVEEAHAFDAEVKAIAGDLAERRTTFLDKIPELNNKRNAVSVLEAPYAALEAESLHVGIEETPAFISAIYAQTLSFITTELGKIYDEMVNNYDALAAPIIADIKAKDAEAKGFEGSLEEKKAKFAEILEASKGIEGQFEQLDAPFAELTTFKLNYRAAETPKDVHSHYDQLVARLNHLSTATQGQIVETENNKRVGEYNEKADALMAQSKAIEAEVEAIGGELEEKRQALYSREADVTSKAEKVEEIVPIYSALEADGLHLEIENPPSAIKDSYENIISHIKFLVSQIDAAIVAKKGMEIPEEQLAEFRETFAFFDKDNSKTLQPYELNACLTALGDTATEDECKQIIHKYSTSGTSNDMNFDEYCKFMLDRFSKTENAATTKEAFTALAQNSPVLTEAQLAQHFSPEDVEYLKGQMEAVDGGYNFGAWVDSVYAQ